MWGGYQNYGPVLGTLNIGSIGTILGFVGNNGKENGNYYVLGILYIYPSSPFLGTLNIRCRIVIGTKIGPIILTINHVSSPLIASCLPL